ncbi:MAG: BatD family protein [Proteobacteria bacterium]|nr:BatD family protein [Pseudomonadota bacterium]
MVNKFSIFLILAMLVPRAFATEVKLNIEPPSVIANESFRLIFTTDGSVDAEPTFGELDGVIDILGRNRQTSIQWINGKNTQSTTWVLDVIALNTGTVTIPSVAFGSDRSPARSIEVAANGTGPATGTDTSLILETEVDVDNPYVQQQIILTARLLRRIELNDAQMTKPSTESDAIIKRLGTDATYNTMRDGKRYEVFERRYSVFPQTSGTVRIAPLTLTTQIVESRGAIFSPFRQQIKTRRIESNDLVIEVKPIPSSYTAATWLPARSVRLRDEWTPDVKDVNAGEPLTRTVFLWADGLNAGQLPELSIDLPAGLKSYPDQPQTSEQETATGFSAIRQQNFAMIPNASGDLVFPSVSVTWWNVESDKMEVTQLPERRFVVAGLLNDDPAASSTPVAVPNVATPLADPENAVADTIATEYQQSFSNRYLIPAIVSLLGWVITALAWWLSVRRSRKARDTGRSVDEVPASNARARRDVLGACKAHDPVGAKRALIAWSRIEFGEDSINSLGEVAKRVSDPLNTEVRLLDRHLYSAEGGKWDPMTLVEAFNQADKLRDRHARLKQTVNPLPDLRRLAPR